MGIYLLLIAVGFVLGFVWQKRAGVLESRDDTHLRLRELTWHFVDFLNEPCVTELCLETFREEHKGKTSVVVTFLYGIFYQRLRRFKKAGQIFQSLLRTAYVEEPESDMIRIQEVARLYSEGSFDEALLAYSQLSRKLRQKGPVQALEGCILEQKRDLDGALKIFRRLLKDYPKLTSLKAKVDHLS